MKNEQGHTNVKSPGDYVTTVTLLIFLFVMILLAYLALGTANIFESLY